ncbi:MAG: CDP-alcohol phosphatidyltransferase family protein [bacterium]|nr:CDP-alcohol phosphatidyltransferase family protein [bacterium]MCY3951742.1 CDP-alcohol phosphatidyltransferase family protein [bacterium]
MFDGRWRAGVDRVVVPIGKVLWRLGVRADHVTLFGVAASAATAAMVVIDRFGLAFTFIVLAGLGDLLDGPVAKAAGTVSTRGAFLDSVCDRISDTLILGALTYHLLDDGVLALLPVAVLASGQFVSYLRAKAESLGLDARGGLAERAERFVVLCFGLLVVAWLPYVLWALLGLTLVTVVQRFAKIWRQF